MPPPKPAISYKATPPFVELFASLCTSAFNGDDTIAREALNLKGQANRLAPILLGSLEEIERHFGFGTLRPGMQARPHFYGMAGDSGDEADEADEAYPVGLFLKGTVPPRDLGKGGSQPRDGTDTVYRFNHGSFGTPFRSAGLVRLALLDALMRAPYAFVEHEGGAALALAVAAAARFLGIRGSSDAPEPPTHALHFVDNTTTGVATIVNSIQPLTSDNAVISTSTAYPSISTAIERRCDAAGATHAVIEVRPRGFTPEAFLASLEAELVNQEEQGRKVRLVVIDHIASGNGIVFPVRRAAELCHRHDAELLVDGAHAVGALELNILDLGADYYVTNFHKWGYVPLSVAVLFVRRREDSKDWLRPMLDSLGASSNIVSERFIFGGTRDLGPLMVIPSALSMFNAFGGVPAVAAYGHRTAREIALGLAEAWATETLFDLGSNDESFGVITCVRVPGVPDGLRTGAFVHRLAMMLYEGIEHPEGSGRTVRADAVFKVIDGDVWIRVSAALYSDVDEHLSVLGPAVPRLVAMVSKEMTGTK